MHKNVSFRATLRKGRVKKALIFIEYCMLMGKKKKSPVFVQIKFFKGKSLICSVSSALKGNKI